MLKKLLGLLLLATTAHAEFNVPELTTKSALLFERDTAKPGYSFVPAGITGGGVHHLWYAGSDLKHPGDNVYYRNAKNIEGPYGIGGKNTYEVALAPNHKTEDHICDPTVIKLPNGKWYMYFGTALEEYHNTRKFITEIGVATSDDGRHWTRTSTASIFRSHPDSPGAHPNIYGTGQPSVVYRPDGFTYIFYTDTVSPNSNATNGAGVYVARSKNPLFTNGVQAWNGSTWISVGSGVKETQSSYLQRVSSPLAQVVSIDAQFSAALDAWILGIHGISQTLELAVLDKNNFGITYVGKVKYRGAVENSIGWVDGPGLFRSATGNAVVGSNGVQPIRSIWAGTKTDVFGSKIYLDQTLLTKDVGIPIPTPTPTATPSPTACKKKTIPGYDVLGLAMYCDVFLRAPKLPALSTLMNTFGDPLPCVKRRLAMGGMQVIQVDLIDATCWRNNNCAPGVPRPDDLKTIQKRAAQVRELALLYPDVHFEVSPGLEHDVKSVNTVTSMLKSSKLGCPECEPVNSPFSGATPSGYRIERHGTKVTAELVSSDGASLFDGDNICNDGNKFQHRLSGDETESWINEFNLRCTGEDHSTPPLQRTNKPTDWQFLMIHKIMTTEEDAIPRTPTKCRSIRAFSKGEVNKPTAEFYCNGTPDDGRGNRPLLILKKSGKRGDKFNVYGTDGKTVGCFAYYGPYTVSGFFRWYMGSCSKQNAWDLYRRLGQEWAFADMGNGQCLRFNSLRRENVYR